MVKLILASASERREELLKRLTYDFEIVTSDFDENTVGFSKDYSDYVINIAKGKAKAVANKLSTPSLVIGCDTIVAYGGRVLGKPINKEHAFSMLKMLSGCEHEVYSGIAIINTFNGETNADYVCTKVKFSSITDKEILKYIASGDPMDKAGAYGIQGLGGVFVESINGCYYNVVGLPLNKLNSMLKGMGVNL